MAAAIVAIYHLQVHFAIRSGGHSPNPLWSSVGPDGILLDLQRLDDIKISTDNAKISVGPGARWGNVYESLNASKLAVAGARDPSVGVGGFLLGGKNNSHSTGLDLKAD